MCVKIESHFNRQFTQMWVRLQMLCFTQWFYSMKKM